MNPDVVIVYERKNRELENSVLLKLELERRGYTCVISNYYEGSKFRLLGKGAKVLIVPYLYDDKNVVRNIVRFGRPKQILNLQYEQVLSEKWENFGHHDPKGEACKGIHVCWGEKTKQRMKNAGVPDENVIVPGAIHTDLLREEFRTQKNEVRHELALTFGLDKSKDWVLFLSSFSYANINNERLKINEKASGSKLDDFVKLHTESRDKMLDWFRAVLPESNCCFIYRPHPDEENLKPVLDLEKQYDNFHVINYFSAKKWIESSDKIYSWYSTTVVEAHFLNLPYSILRPIPLPDYFDSVLLKKAKFITNKDFFISNFNDRENSVKFALTNEDVSAYYAIDEVPAYLKICDYVEEIIIGERRACFKLSLNHRLFFKIKSFGALGVYWMYRLTNPDLSRNSKKSGSFLNRWFLEMSNHIASEGEIFDIERELRRKLSRK